MGRLDEVDLELFSDMAGEIATLVDVITPLDRDTLLQLSAAHAAIYEVHPDQLVHGLLACGLSVAVSRRDCQPQ